ncbi:MAG: dTDP-4-dehydrorhamnose reductase [Bacteroidetes bacterium]|nr:dTDP-4-dehydrorhamnose reductase [Bacteroidota bacterium]
MDSCKNILVTGANGQLGMEFRALVKLFPAYQFFFTTKDDLPITDTRLVEKYFSEKEIYCCINCAAYTAVDKSETDRDTALLVNADAALALASICKEYKSIFFHFSTDYVFDGNAHTAYTENFETKPVNFYGQTKLEGEQQVQKNNADAIIIRTSWVYSSYGKNFVKTMLRLMSEKESIAVVNDQLGSPTYAADLALAVMHILQSGTALQGGIYHYCNEGVISWYDFANEIKLLSHSKCTVNAISTSEYPTPAKRPKYSALQTDKIKNTFHITIPGWKDSLYRCIKLLQ